MGGQNLTLICSTYCWWLEKLSLFCFCPIINYNSLNPGYGLCLHNWICLVGTWRHLLRLLIAHLLLLSHPQKVHDAIWPADTRDQSFQNETNEHSGRFRRATARSLKNMNHIRLLSGCIKKEPLSGREARCSSWFQRCLRQMHPATFKGDNLLNIWPWFFLGLY